MVAIQSYLVKYKREFHIINKKKFIYIIILLFLAIFLLIFIKEYNHKRLNDILKDFPKEDYYTKILHALEEPDAPKTIMKDGKKFALSTYLDKEDRLKFTLENVSIAFFTKTIRVTVTNDSEFNHCIGENFDGLEYKDGDFWILSPGYSMISDAVAIEIPAKKSTSISFHISPNKMAHGRYRIICTYDFPNNKVKIIGYIEFEY